MNFRELTVAERPNVNAFYQKTTYKRAVAESDRVFVAEKATTIFGAVRIESSDGVQVLRGMYMDPAHVRKGIGARLLHAIEPVLAETESFCIPRDHLFEFYGRAAFRVIDPGSAPAFLSERLSGYLAEGIPVAIMHRPAGPRATAVL